MKGREAQDIQTRRDSRIPKRGSVTNSRTQRDASAWNSGARGKRDFAKIHRIKKGHAEVLSVQQISEIQKGVGATIRRGRKSDGMKETRKCTEISKER